ncbi:hypothetical protein EEL31_13560 [Brevibacillus laterosporus]|uniref:DUF1648 domain-containing protein n=1 Tax=Brevibacillus laterosporus TaxID=1465 RepID=A0A518VEV6_BRELA|nr:SdpI family protein [Brevibacillus laterosporus]QDX95523.1 hypothetical protein EEL30_26615 [Brevibacillus laterosporus]TPG69435.1 hypothetical protein EEL31_13560 [Brevibacillus laterosporus]
MQLRREQRVWHWLDFMLVLITMSPIIAAIGFYTQMPDKLLVATRIGEKTGYYQDKLLFLLIFSLVQIIAPILIRLFITISRQRELQTKRMNICFDLLRIAQAVLFSTMYCFLILQNLLIPIGVEMYVMIIVGIILLVYGYLLPWISYLHPLGMRTSWTKKEQEVWVSTHCKLSVFWMITGTVYLLCPYLPGWLGLLLITISVCLTILSTYIYSYLYFRRGKGKQNKPSLEA